MSIKKKKKFELFEKKRIEAVKKILRNYTQFQKNFMIKLSKDIEMAENIINSISIDDFDNFAKQTNITKEMIDNAKEITILKPDVNTNYYIEDNKFVPFQTKMIVKSGQMKIGGLLRYIL